MRKHSLSRGSLARVFSTSLPLASALVLSLSACAHRPANLARTEYAPSKSMSFGGDYPGSWSLVSFEPRVEPEYPFARPEPAGPSSTERTASRVSDTRAPASRGARTLAPASNGAAPTLSSRGAHAASALDAMPLAPLDDARDGDAEVMAFVAELLEAQLTEAQHARSNAADPRVRELGARFVDAYGRASALRFELGTRIDLRPRATERSRAFASELFLVEDRLPVLRGAEFDRAYLLSVTAQHERALELLDRLLVPTAANPALRAMLEGELRPLLRSRLDDLRALQHGV